MSDWTVWNWIAYGCLAISAFGGAIGTIFKKYPEIASRLPSAFSNPLWSFVPAAFLVLATAIFIWQLLFPSLVAKSELTLRTYGDNRWPDRVSGKNDYRFFYLRGVVKSIHPTGEKTEAIVPCLFVTFSRPTRTGTLTVNSPDMRLPRHEVKEFNQRFAVIVFDDELPLGTLKISTF
jgi:hypothetical protein